MTTMVSLSDRLPVYIRGKALRMWRELTAGTTHPIDQPFLFPSEEGNGNFFCSGPAWPADWQVLQGQGPARSERDLEAGLSAAMADGLARLAIYRAEQRHTAGEHHVGTQ